jgi:peroxiredoxin
MKNCIYLCIITLIFAACSSEPHYVVKGKIEGSDSILFYLQKRDAGKVITIDSAFSKKGSFTIKGGVIEYPQMVQLVAGNTKKRTSFYLENSEITITGSLDSLFKAEITGSRTEDEYKSYIASNKVLTDKYSQVYLAFQTANRAGDTAQVSIIRNRIDSITAAMTNNQKNFVRNNPSSFVTPSILGSLAVEMEAEELELMLSGLDSTIAALPQIKTLKERVAVMKVVAVGQKAPDFTMNDVDGKPVTLSSKTGYKLLLIDFWAAWCGPCRRENPNVVKVYNEFHKKGFDILGVSLDREKEAWLKAISDDKLTWTHVSDLQYWQNAAAKLYAVNAIPANFLLDETGTIIGRNLRGEDLYKKVNEVLGVKK